MALRAVSGRQFLLSIGYWAELFDDKRLVPVRTHRRR
jgi:hypothetical protein